ncbi:coiled-coil domain-containing protein 125-like isoform X2 [Haliotis rubra]|uniref:coiled-coil domain-containing protein 125-like isoform X2 n=1 Tax=Haliotis rubra TaxID=36100 RepID=UPI001EE5BA0E|nr:coiled-coil domain-containing protein 125-like isoform X2 [Haliotis rubra]
MDREDCHRKHADKSDKLDDKFSIVCGDLGLGEGLKPGGILQGLNLPEFPDGASNVTPPHNESTVTRRNSQPCHVNGSDSVSRQTPERRKSLVFKSKTRGRSADSNDTSPSGSEHFPTYADIPLGTSLRQQRKLFEQNLGSLRKRHDMSTSEELSVNSADGDNNRKRLTSVEIEKKLLEALQEVEELKIELDTCQKRLDAKYMAIAILKRQADESTEEYTITEKITRECSKMLAEDSAVDLSGDLSGDQSAGGGDVEEGEGLLLLPPHELLWDDEALLQRVCQENGLLMSTLEARSEELRRANCQKMALARERDELLALLDVKEKLKYERTRSTASDEDYGTYSSAELAVLGACQCRGTKTEPCGCAHAAANLRRDTLRLREEIELYKHRRDEAYLTVDAYRKAFEEQLNRNKFLTLKLSELTIPASSKPVKAKAAIKWLISVLNDDDLHMSIPHHGLPNGPLSGINTTLMTPQELITLLSEMVHEKCEALAHQKLAAQVLANKVESLEKQMRALKEEDVFT